MRLRITHTTRYTYPGPVTDSHNEVRLMPLSDGEQTCLDFWLQTEPSVRLFAYDLPTGRVHHFNMRAPHTSLTLSAESLVVTHHRNPFEGLQLVEDDSEFYTRENVRQRYIEYLAPTRRVPLYAETDRIAAVARKQAGVGTASFLIALTRLLHRVVAYAPGSTHVDTTLASVLEEKRGVCQDFAHLMLSVCRRQGIPARYISGYLYTGKHSAATESANSVLNTPASLHMSEGRGHQQEPDMTDLSSQKGELVGDDAMHAWVECLLPDGEWHGFDPTNNLLTNDAYIKVHFGRDYGDVTPVRGIYHGPPTQSLDVSVRVAADR